MAQAAAQLEEIPMIEEQVDTGLKELLDTYRAPFVPGGDPKDMLSERFTLYPTRPLPEFSHAYAQAYEAYDDFNKTRSVYAMVCDNNMPTRAYPIHELTAVAHANMCTLLGAGTVNCSHLNEARTVLFIERPRGNSLLELVKKQQRLHEHKIIDMVLNPAIKALTTMREKKICHGHIHPGNFYLSDTPQLGECFSAPCSTMNHYLYEPFERLLADPLGRGEATEKSDTYALAILAYELMYGLDKIKAIPRDVFIQQVMNFGSYHVFCSKRELSDTFTDFFRGILNDNPGERWGLDQLNAWIGGKRFNVIAPVASKEAVRPITFMNEEYHSRRTLACAFHKNWREALKDIKEMRVERWCETSLHRPELSDQVDRVIRIVSSKATDVQQGEMLSRVLSILDPVAPLRTQALALRPDAMGQYLADMMHHNVPEISQLVALIEGDFGNFWAEQAEANKSTSISNAVWRQQRARPYLRNKALGFGLKRVLYELNPSLCCQSPLVKQYHVTSALELLKTLDAIAPMVASDATLVDRDIAAFIASKIDMSKVVRLTELASVPSLAFSEELVMLKLLAKAQQKHHKLQLLGLCAWAAMRVEKELDNIHNRVLRKRLKLRLKKLAQSGNLFEVLTAIINNDVIHRDLNDFTKAIALYELNTDRMDRLNNEDILVFKSKRMGGKMAMIISHFALFLTIYFTLAEMYGI